VLDCQIDVVTWDDALLQLSAWSTQRASRYVCASNVHSIVTARMDRAFQGVINDADLAVPDGAPVAWALRRLGYANQERINGPDLMWRFCGVAEEKGISVYLYGATETTLARLQESIRRAFPRLTIAGTWSPPFEHPSLESDAAAIDRINRSGAGVVFIALGCPKQEQLMKAWRGKIRAPMVGVGAAFDFHAGIVARAPQWMQRYALEWLYRLIREPRRLWKRYLVTNTLFSVGIAMQLLRRQQHRPAVQPVPSKLGPIKDPSSRARS
jgi:N-acetylglucosaminyldiphosphoundecaprenol N-acetyl-beta-D-mannosaminyltransferase